MRIGSHIGSPSFSQLNQTQRSITRALERLSTGRRVNSARDDVAAISFSTLATSQIRGLRQDVSNINQNLSMLTVADSALSSLTDLIQRMRELSVLGSNGSLSSTDRDGLHEELMQLVQEYDRILNDSEFNTRNVFGDLLQNFSLGLSTNITDPIEADIDDLSRTNAFARDVLIGNGTFTAGTTLTTGDANLQSELVDLDNDGDLDLVSANFNATTLTFFDNSGTGSFTAIQTLNVGGNPSNVIKSNLNGDAYEDLTIVLANNIVRGAINNGNGTYTLTATVNGGGFYADSAVGDFNGDGFDDVVVGTTSAVMVYHSDGEGNFEGPMALYGSSGYGVSAGDLNNDGRDDIAIADPSASPLVAYLSTGDHSFVQSVYLSNAGGYDVALEDFNNDGNLDFFVKQSGGARVVALGNGNGTYSHVVTTPLGSGIAGGASYGAGFLDFNGDGYLDEVYQGSAAGVLEFFTGNGDGTFTFYRTDYYGGVGGFSKIKVGDLNGDGVEDFTVNQSALDQMSIRFTNTVLSESLASFDLRTRSGAQELLLHLDQALDNITSARAEVSALHSRLEISSSQALLLSDTLDEARSKSIDADIALEVAELTRNQILQQMQVATLAQANTQMQVVLSLFKGL